MDELEKLRKEIDLCDKEIAPLIYKRMDLVTRILEHKKKQGMKVYQPEREEEVIKKAISNLKEDNYIKEIEIIFKKIIEVCRTFQTKELLSHNICLIGFMGAGKTHIGKELSKLLEMEFHDIDYIIEARFNKSIPQIFEELGEDYFRDAERTMIEEVSQKDNAIISCGGGVILHNANIMNLKRKGKVIWLKAQPETIYQRIKDDTSRPLLKDNMTLTHISALLSERWQKYKSAADYTIETDNLTTEEVCEEVIKVLAKM